MLSLIQLKSVQRNVVGHVYMHGSKSTEKANTAENRCILKGEYCKRYLGQRELYS